MTIWSLLVSLTATTLGLAAFSPHAAQAEDFPSFSFMKFRLESMRPELESYVSGISSAKRQKRDHHRSGEREDCAGNSRNQRDCDLAFMPHEEIPRDRCCAVQRYLHRAVGDQLHDCRASQTGRPGLLEQGGQQRRDSDIQGHLHERMGNEQLTEPGRSSAVVASLQPPETVGSALRADARPTEKSCSDCRSSKEIHDDSPEF